MHSGHKVLLCCACEREAEGVCVCASGGRDIMRARQTLDSNAVFSSSLCSPPEFCTYARVVPAGLEVAMRPNLAP